MKNTILLLLAAILLCSCQTDQSNTLGLEFAAEDEMIPVTRQTKSMAAPNPNTPISQQNTSAKIIKDGNMSLEVNDIHASKQQVDSLLHQNKAYYSNERFNNSTYEFNYILTLRIPNNHFELFIASLESGNANVTYKEITARDVTNQFIDLEARLTNKKSYLKRYRELLSKAKTIKEILEIQEKIRNLEEELESTAGQLKYLNDQVNFSTLRLVLTQKKDYKYKPTERDSFAERLKQSFSKGWNGFVDFTLIVIKAWPFWFILAGVIYVLRRIRRIKKLKKTDSSK